MKIERPRYLNKLIERRQNGLIKVISGNRRAGKSYLLFNLYHDYLIEDGVDESCIVQLALDEFSNTKYRNPFELDKFIRQAVSDSKKTFYVFIDEIQFVKSVKNPYLDDEKIGFVDVLLGLMKLKNVDLYVTGSNSRMLSSDIKTQFRDRGDEIRVYPLSFAEFYSSLSENERQNAWHEYSVYGGMPLAVTKKKAEGKSKYLNDLFEKTYISDVLEHNNIQNDKAVLEDLMNIISSSVGSLTNPTTIANTFRSVKKTAINPETIIAYLGFFEDAFLISKAKRYDVKGKKYIETPLKYYFVDVGLRNAMLNFRQTEESHIMENVIYNELQIRGFNVDVGVVAYNGKNAEGKSYRAQLEIDFVVNSDSRRYYIQSVLSIPDDEKLKQETHSLRRVSDSFKKIMIVRDAIIPRHDEDGILYLGLERFLLDETALDL